MKYLIITILILIANFSFGQSFNYEGFQLKTISGSGSYDWSYWPLSLKISNLGYGNFEILTIPLDRGFKFEGKFDQYNSWEKLYRYTSIHQNSAKDKSDINSGAEFTTETVITSKCKLEDFAKGINIPNREFAIKVYQKSIHRYTTNENWMYIIPFSKNATKMPNQQEVDVPKVVEKVNNIALEKRGITKVLEEKASNLFNRIYSDHLFIIESVSCYISDLKTWVLSLSFSHNGNDLKSGESNILEDKKTTTTTNSEMPSIKKIVINWNDAHNNKDMVVFSYLFADEVNFYQTKLSRNTLIQKKTDLLKKYPDFNQQIKGEIITEKLDNDEVKCSFDKEVTINGKVTNYPSYLILKKSGEQWKVSVESDIVTDRNVVKKKSLNR